MTNAHVARIDSGFTLDPSSLIDRRAGVIDEPDSYPDSGGLFYCSSHIAQLIRPVQSPLNSYKVLRGSHVESPKESVQGRIKTVGRAQVLHAMDAGQRKFPARLVRIALLHSGPSRPHRKIEQNKTNPTTRLPLRKRRPACSSYTILVQSPLICPRGLNEN